MLNIFLSRLRHFFLAGLCLAAWSNEATGIEQRTLKDNYPISYWSNPSCWEEYDVPDTFDECALIPSTLDDPFCILNQSPSIDSFRVESTSALVWLNGYSLTFGGPSALYNAGTIEVNSGTVTINVSCSRGDNQQHRANQY